MQVSERGASYFIGAYLRSANLLIYTSWIFKSRGWSALTFQEGCLQGQREEVISGWSKTLLGKMNEGLTYSH